MVYVRVFIQIALQKTSLLGGAQIAVVVGSLLNLINQGDLLLTAAWVEVHWPKLFLTFCVPLCVSIFSATKAKMRFDPGTRAVIAARLKCRACGEETVSTEDGKIIPECPMCGSKTDWVLVAER